MFKVQLPQSMDDRITALALRTGKSKSYIIREAILEHLDDLEERFFALAGNPKSHQDWELDQLNALRFGGD